MRVKIVGAQGGGPDRGKEKRFPPALKISYTRSIFHAEKKRRKKEDSNTKRQ